MCYLLHVLTRERGSGVWTGENREVEGEKSYPEPRSQHQKGAAVWLAGGLPHTGYLNVKGLFLNTAPEHWGPSPSLING